MDAGNVNAVAMDSELWAAAKVAMLKEPNGLSETSLLKLVDKATAKDGVSVAEANVLKAVVNPEVVQAFVSATKRKVSFDVSGINFDTARSRAIMINAAVGTAGTAVGKTYDPAAAGRAASIRSAAATVAIGPGQALTMATGAGRDAILDAYGQLAGSTTYGAQACAAASLIALAVNAGPTGLGALAKIVRNDRDYDPTFATLCDRMASADPDLTLADLATLQDALLERMQNDQTNRDVIANRELSGETEGLRPDSIVRFVQEHQQDLAPLFAGGANILAIDNTGDGALDHFVAYVPRDGAKRIFEPWETADHHHLITDATRIADYAKAQIR